MMCSIGRSQLNDIAHEALKLVKINIDDFPARLFNTGEDALALFSINNALATHHDEVRSHGHQHIGMVNRSSLSILRSKELHLIAHNFGKVPQHIGMCAPADGGKGNFICPIQDHAPGALEVFFRPLKVL